MQADILHGDVHVLSAGLDPAEPEAAENVPEDEEAMAVVGCRSRPSMVAAIGSKRWHTFH